MSRVTGASRATDSGNAYLYSGQDSEKMQEINVNRIKDIHKPARNPFLLPWGQYKIETMPGRNCTDAEKATTPIISILIR